ncbi:GntR family transcriptional regulator [Streptomyces sp. NPDC059096]|uniref:GntR family transcriptional regulator n=1 Tax=Streptomyces sp. NPDC059096 TaxID=3346727 RepID=UPI0036C3FCEF
MSQVSRWERTVNALADLRSRITSGAWAPGFTMRSSDLEDRYGLHPEGVLHIVKTLRAEGLIETRSGVGSRVVGASGPVWVDPCESTAMEVVERAVRSRIRDGTYAPGTQIPSVSVLGEEFGVHRVTAAVALRPIKREGLLAYVSGRGTFVSEPGRQRTAP